MVFQREDLHPLAAAAVKELEGRGYPAAVEDVLWLHRLAKRVDRPFGADRIRAAGLPVRCGNLLLWPFTIGAGQWYSEVGFPLFGESRLGIFVLAFALAHSRQPKVFEPLTTYRAIKAAVHRWKRTIGATLAEVTEAVAELIDVPMQEGDQENKGHGVEVEEFVAGLCEVYGQPPTFWRWGEDQSECLNLIALHNKRSRMSGDAPDPEDPATRAFYEFRQGVAAIIKAGANCHYPWRYRTIRMVM